MERRLTRISHQVMKEQPLSTFFCINLVDIFIYTWKFILNWSMNENSNIIKYSSSIRREIPNELFYYITILLNNIYYYDIFYAILFLAKLRLVSRASLGEVDMYKWNITPLGLLNYELWTSNLWAVTFLFTKKTCSFISIINSQIEKIVKLIVHTDKILNLF